MLTPRPWQVTGAEFLAARTEALLADDPRVGKCGAALLACNLVGAKRIDVITTRSGIPVWQRAFDQWGLEAPSRRIISWSSPAAIAARAGELRDVLIVDESHKAASPSSQRTEAVFGSLFADGMFHRERAAVCGARRVWCLSGTPAPHDNSNWWPMLRSLRPSVLGEVRSWPAFLERYCVTAKKRLPNGRQIDVVVGGRRSDELRHRLKGFILRRTQADVGISEPTFDLLPLHASVAISAMFDDVDEQRVLAAADAGRTDELEDLLSTLQRLTGTVKVPLIAEAVEEDLKNGTDKIVIAYWHRDVGDKLQDLLQDHGVLRLDGSTSADRRAEVQALWNYPNVSQRVFLAQMEAAGEAIDLSAAASMIIAEPVFRPTTMRQMALRITNVNRRSTPLVRVAVLAGSLDERIQDRLMALWAPIKEVLRA